MAPSWSASRSRRYTGGSGYTCITWKTKRHTRGNTTFPSFLRINVIDVSPSISQFMYQSMYLLYRHTHFYFNTKSANLAGGFTERDGRLGCGVGWARGGVGAATLGGLAGGSLEASGMVVSCSCIVDPCTG